MNKKQQLLRDIDGGTTNLNHPIYLKDGLTSERKSGNILNWRRGYALFSDICILLLGSPASASIRPR